ncbi:MAG TPA: hypothetical protein VHH35_02465 [Pyrinomonadaceae bacterium]|nr:hypothetical protein [Pyrinomonadaceae bacterium]
MRFFKLLILVGFLSVIAAAAEPVRLLPDQISKFRYSKPVNSEFAVDSATVESAEYAGSGSRILVDMIRFPHDAKAYEMLSLVAAASKAQITADYGTAGFARENEIAFFKGTHFVRLRNLKGEDLTAAAQDLASSLDKGENDIPALIKHLPNPEEAQKTAVFLHSFANLDRLGLQQGVLTAIESMGNADAAFAAYGPGKVLIVEFNTPQLAKENDERITARIQELWKLGQPAPTAYRRVGNYSVFVFDAPNDAAARQLMDQVKYEQVVQWLGENPNILKQAQQHYVNTTLGVLVAVLKASGYALLACLGIGGLAGALLFTHRRAQQAKNLATFSDAGGMLRLNLDDLTPETDPARLLRDRN